MKKNIAWIYNLFLVLLILPFFEPTYISVNFSKLHSLINLWKIGNLFIVLLIYIKNMKISKYMIGILLYEFIVIFSTCINTSGNLNLAILDAISIIGICMILEYELTLKPKRILGILEIVFILLITINFISILKYPNGLYATERYKNNWVLGYDNVHIVTFIPALMISMINGYFKGDKLTLKFLYLLTICSLSVFICWSGNSLVAIILFDLFIIFKNRIIHNSNIFNYTNYLIVHISLFVSIVILRLQKIFSWLVVDILHKNLTFTGRTYIWDSTLELISRRKVIGYGVETSFIRTFKLGNKNATHAHNHILEIVYKSGIIGMIIYMYILYIVGKSLNYYKKNIISAIISFSILIFFIMMLIEARDKMQFYIILIMGYFIKYIIDDINITRKKLNLRKI